MIRLLTESLLYIRPAPLGKPEVPYLPRAAKVYNLFYFVVVWKKSRNDNELSEEEAIAKFSAMEKALAGHKKSSEGRI